MQDPTGGVRGRSNRNNTVGDPRLDEKVRQLVDEMGTEKPRELIEEMITTALKMARDQTSVADLKMLNRALKELRYAVRVFAPYRERRKVAVFGSARTPEDAEEYKAAETFGREMVERGYMIVTGGGDGIMGAAQKGAGREHSFGLNIRLPFEQSANETIDGDKKLINFNYFFTRKLNFVKETHAIALFPGGFGTMDEGFEVLTLMQTGKARIFPLVLVDKAGGTYWQTWLDFLHNHLLKLRLISPDDFNLLHHCESVECAVEHIVRFYHNFHSYRWVGGRLVMRLQQPLTQKKIERMDTEFSDVLATGKFAQCSALPEESGEPEIAHLPRLVFQPHRRNFGRLRKVIDAVNEV
ncbi:MAG: TIGR00730 family Rossman fold protein [Chthoniobacteraceae bacterium]